MRDPEKNQIHAPHWPWISSSVPPDWRLILVRITRHQRVGMIK
jgi:hypothetical protein